MPRVWQNLKSVLLGFHVVGLASIFLALPDVMAKPVTTPTFNLSSCSTAEEEGLLRRNLTRARVWFLGTLNKRLHDKLGLQLPTQPPQCGFEARLRASRMKSRPSVGHEHVPVNGNADRVDTALCPWRWQCFQDDKLFPSTWFEAEREHQTCTVGVRPGRCVPVQVKVPYLRKACHPTSPTKMIYIWQWRRITAAFTCLLEDDHKTTS